MPANAGNDKFRTIEITEIASTATEQISLNTPSPEDETPPHKVEAEPISTVEQSSPVASTAKTQAMEPLNDTGQGVPLSEFTQRPPKILPGGSNTVEGSRNPGSTEPALANIIESGTRFVFLIDTLDSMRNSDRWYWAQIQLMSNLRMLKPHQEFQIIFYSAHPATMKLLGGKQTIYQANARNITNAEKVLEAVSLGGRANHLLALREGLKMKPDGIYILTDRQDTNHSQEDLNRLLVQNKSAARIHVLEFALSAPETRDTTWLQRLARKLVVYTIPYRPGNHQVSFSNSAGAFPTAAPL